MNFKLKIALYRKRPKRKLHLDSKFASKQILQLTQGCKDL